MSGRKAIAFGPVQPTWDEGAFFAPVTERLRSRGITVQLIDTVALVDTSMTVQDLAARWFTRLGHTGRVDLLCGNALGGAVAQAYAAHLDVPVPVLSVSGPGRSDPVLAERLGEIADLADRGRLDAALALLQRRVVPRGSRGSDRPRATVPAVSAESDDPIAARRITLGLRMLCDLDLSGLLSDYAAPITTVVGSDSQLVTEQHASTTPQSQTIIFEGAGMRPHHDRPELLDSVVTTLIKEMETAPWT